MNLHDQMREALEAVEAWDADHALAAPDELNKGLTVGVRAHVRAALKRANTEQGEATASGAAEPDKTPQGAGPPAQTAERDTSQPASPSPPPERSELVERARALAEEGERRALDDSTVGDVFWFAAVSKTLQACAAALEASAPPLAPAPEEKSDA